MNLKKISIIIIIIGIFADLLQIFDNSYVIDFLSSILPKILPILLFLTIVALAYTAIYYREKYKNQKSNIKLMVANAWDVLNARFKRNDIITERFRGKYKILNEKGDCKQYISWRIKAKGSTPFHSMESYIAYDEGKTSKDEFYNSLKCENANIVHLEEIKIQDYNILIFRIDFTKSIDNKTHYDFSLEYKLNGVIPLDKKDNDVGVHVAMPTESTGCILELPPNWEIIHRRAEYDDRVNPPTLLPDNHFAPIEKEGFEWSFNEPKEDSYYHVYFTAKKVV